MIHPDDTILVAGAHGMVGQALVRAFYARGYRNLLTPTRKELDLREQGAVREYFAERRPDVVVVSAAKVGGIYANMRYPAEFLYDNVMIATHTIEAAHRYETKRLLFLGSSCIYPREAAQPIREEALLTGALEKTNEAYALAKIVGVKLCHYYREQYGRAYISAMPTNLYGPADRYDLENSHVIPALIYKFHQAKIENKPEVVLWGTGRPLREFLYVDDLAEASLLLLERYERVDPINIGSEEELSIRSLADEIANVVGYSGCIVHDLSKPDGTPRKKTDGSRLASLGWHPKISLQEGLRRTYQDFLLTHLTHANFKL